MTRQATIWLIGGTRESAELSRLLMQIGLPCVVTVTTEEARSLYPESPLLQIYVGSLSRATLPSFLRNYGIATILDASHPFAVEISQLAIATAAELTLPYLRYERPALTATGVVFSSVQELLTTQQLAHQRVLLTLGYRCLELFRPWQEHSTLFARILPSQAALTVAIAAGFTPDRLIALRPPISAALEQSLWQQWQISTVVTKASGAPGGEDIKERVAAELGVTLIRIARPTLIYPAQTSHAQQAVQFCHRAIATGLESIP